jgi:ribonuclease HI
MDLPRFQGDEAANDVADVSFPTHELGVDCGRLDDAVSQLQTAMQSTLRDLEEEFAWNGTSSAVGLVGCPNLKEDCDSPYSHAMVSFSDNLDSCVVEDGQPPHDFEATISALQTSWRADVFDVSWLCNTDASFPMDSNSESSPLLFDKGIWERCSSHVKEIRQVSFQPRVEVYCFDQDESTNIMIPLERSSDFLRNFWHLHGEIANLETIRQAFAQMTSSQDATQFCGQRASSSGDCTHEDDEQFQSRSQDDTCDGNVRLLETALESKTDHYNVERPVFADTWFLSNGHFPLCLRPRRVRLKDGTSGDKFLSDCRQVWHDIIDLRGLQAYVVSGSPRGLPSTVLHVILFQGELQGLNLALFRSEGLPPLFRQRAVLFPATSTVKDLFRLVQFPDSCDRQRMQCFITWSQDEAQILRTTEQQVNSPLAMFMEGNARVVQEDVSDDDQFGSSQQSTQVPERDSEDEEDVSVMMSGGPIMGPPEIPFHHLEEDNVPGPDQLMQEEATSLAFAMHHFGHVQDHVEMIMADLPEDQQQDQWVAVTFGLGLVDLGRRDIGFHPWNLNELMRLLLDLWNDHAQYGNLLVYNVHPQPMDIAGEKSITLIVQVEMDGQDDDRLKPVLVLERAVAGIPVRPTYFAAWLYTESTATEIIRQLDLQQYCPPLAARECGVRMGTVSLHDGHRYEFDSGMLCLLWIGHVQQEVHLASQRVIHAEAFFLQWRCLINLQPEHEHIVLFAHGVSPNNRPMGHRQMVWGILDTQNLAWIDFLAQLWPFWELGYTIAFVESLSQDVAGMERPCFHFVVSYGEHDGIPIVIQQQIGVAETMPRQEMMVDELWAINMPDQVVSHSLPGVALGNPFWFRIARQQNIYPHLFLEGQRAREVDRQWRPGDLLRARFLVWQRQHALSILLQENNDRTSEELESTSFLQTGKPNSIFGRDSNTDFNDRTSFGSWFPHDDFGFQEICNAIWSQSGGIESDVSDGSSDRSSGGRTGDNPDPCLPHFSSDDNSRMQNQLSDTIQSADVNVQELKHLIWKLQNQPWQGLNFDFQQVPDLHPFTQWALRATQAIREDESTNVFHIFTDGSAKQGEASWAFIVLCEQRLERQSRYFRIGYAARKLSDDLGRFSPSAQDAEATALIAAGEYLFTRTDLCDISVHFHFDALAVGNGSLGKTKTIAQDSSISERQKMARIMLSLIQKKAESVSGIHVHAHEGQPWNEGVDSIARIVISWQNGHGS